MKRRNMVLLLSSLPFVAQAQPVVAALTLEAFVKILGDAGSALSTFTKGLKDAVIAGKDSLKYIEVEKERARLITISKAMTQLITTKQQTVIGSIDEYLRVVESTPSMPSSEKQMIWYSIVDAIELTLKAVHELLTNVRAENGNLVLEPAYLNISKSLEYRAAALSKLKSMPAPTAAADIKLLRQANENYRELLSNAEKALVELNNYARTTKQS